LKSATFWPKLLRERRFLTMKQLSLHEESTLEGALSSLQNVSHTVDNMMGARSATLNEAYAVAAVQTLHAILALSGRPLRDLVKTVAAQHPRPELAKFVERLGPAFKDLADAYDAEMEARVDVPVVVADAGVKS
jgi:hypothetical protein